MCIRYFWPQTSGNPCPCYGVSPCYGASYHICTVYQICKQAAADKFDIIWDRGRIEWVPVKSGWIWERLESISEESDWKITILPNPIHLSRSHVKLSTPQIGYLSNICKIWAKHMWSFPHLKLDICQIFVKSEQITCESFHTSNGIFVKYFLHKQCFMENNSRRLLEKEVLQYQIEILAVFEK